MCKKRLLDREGSDPQCQSVMDPTPEQVKAFGEEARRLRLERELTLREVAELVADEVNERVQHQDISNWETKHAPKTREKAVALDRALRAGGELVALLDGSGLAARVSRIEAVLQAQQAQIDRVLDLLQREDRQ
jgi:transcriptional regulator with XRE-family HTH domain